MNLPKIIQGGMGVAISDWNLARTVSKAGHLGVVSGTGVTQILISRLMSGDRGGHVRRALSHFPFAEPANRLLEEYFVAEPPDAPVPYKRTPMWKLNPPKSLTEITVIANFVEVFLAKEGHDNPVGLNLLEKLQMPILASLYGAMLAGVQFVIMGAGVPWQVPEALDRLAEHEPASYQISVIRSDPGDDFRIHFDPRETFPGVESVVGPLTRPRFLPIISSVLLAQTLAQRKINGFIIEGPTAGGHNAPPRGPLRLTETGEPIYGEKDVVDLEQIKALGYPFWLAGGYDTPEKFRDALSTGAAGVQVGTAFACCEESGMEPSLKRQILDHARNGTLHVRTDPNVSPTGFPFKVVELEGTLSDPEIYAQRTRLCDIGLLRKAYKREDANLGFRCPAEPAQAFQIKRGRPQELEGKVCLCNNLLASAGFPQHRKDGYVEPPIVTAGDGLESIARFIQPGKDTYSALDVLEAITGERLNPQSA